MSTTAPAADTSGAPQGNEESFGFFYTTGIPQLVEALAQAQRAAGQAGLRDAQVAIVGIINDLLLSVNRQAQVSAARSEAAIVGKIVETQSRNRPHQHGMETHIKSEPGPLGAVRVGLMSELDKIVNPRGYGPFWRAQEYGTGNEGVPSQEGRLLFGTFEPSGDPPDAAQRGLGAGRDLEFVPFGSAPGFGRISVELPGRHFLRDGTLEAGTEYQVTMGVIQAQAIARMKEVRAEVKQAPREGLVRGVLRLE